MSDLEKYSVTGLDGVPKIDPIFTVEETPVITDRITDRIISVRDLIPSQSGKAMPISSFISDKTKINVNPIIKPEDNKLNSYASYTYNISLQMLSLKTYNSLLAKDAISTTQAFNYVPENILVVSGGRIGNKISDIETGTVLPDRHPFWQENFFFEDLKFRTVISPTQQSRGTNVIEGSMQIIEPNGFTFINRLIQTVLNVNPGTNYMFNPYMIVIDFYGMHANTEGSTALEQNPVRIDSLRKLFPICLTSIKSRITNKGAVYTIDFVPYSHSAFNRTNNVSPANFNIEATTVANFFNNNKTAELASAISTTKERQVTLENLKQQKTDLAQFSFGLTQETIDRLNTDIETYDRLVKNGTNVTGFCAAYNQFHEDLIRDKQTKVADAIEIKFDPAIGDSKIIQQADITQAAAKQFLQEKNILLAKGGEGNQTINFNGGLITVPAGTIIDKLIEFIIRNSDYFLSQIKIENSDRSKPLNWYKIIPRVEIGPYDSFRQKNSIKTVYYVVPYLIYAASHPYVSNGLPDGQVKKYDYIFTGKNTEVQELAIDFNMLYNLSLPVNRRQENIAHGQDLEWNPYTLEDKAKSYTADPTQPYSIYMHSGQTRYQGTSGNADILSKQELAASVLHSINLDSRGDMINIKLKIFGDPDFIKQDDVFYNSAFFKEKGIRINGNGSFWMDGGNLTVQVNINSPVDYDDSIGLAVPGRDPYGGIFTYNAFSGIYKIITIENHFYKGKFEQTLDIVRTPIQTVEQLRSADNILNANRKVEVEKALSLAKNIQSARSANTFNIPIRSTAGALTRTSSLLYGQQAAVNQAASAVASLNGIVGGLQNALGLPAQLAQVGIGVAQRAITGVVGKAIDKAASGIIGTFNRPDLDWMNSISSGQELAIGSGLDFIADFEGAGAVAELATFVDLGDFL